MAREELLLPLTLCVRMPSMSAKVCTRRRMRRPTGGKLIVLLGVLLSAVVGHAAGPDRAFLGELANARYPQANWVASGALNQTDVENLRKAGIKHVVSLRTREETAGFDEERTVREQGLVYHSIPIDGIESLTKDNARRLDALFEQIGAEPALIHCSTGNRVGALISVREAWIKGASADAAIAEGKRWGLAKMEDGVRTLLNRTQVQSDERR